MDVGPRLCQCMYEGRTDWQTNKSVIQSINQSNQSRMDG